MSMSFSPGREKALPDIPVDITNRGTATEHEEPRLIPSPNTNKTLPSRNVESEGEMGWLHEVWNEAGLSARAHRRRHRGQNATQCQIPAPISIPEPKGIPSVLPSADLSITDATPPTTGIRKLWGFLSARPISEKQGTGKKSLSAFEILRAIAKDRPRKKLRWAKSAPNLGDGGAPLERGAKLEFAVPRAVPNDAPASRPCIRSPPGELAIPEAVVQPEEMDKNAIYFTVDPTWRASQGSVRFQFITHIPDRPISLWRPDSPLLHRHQSLSALVCTRSQQDIDDNGSSCDKCKR